MSQAPSPFGPHRVQLSRPDKVLFPGTGLTKRDLYDHYVGLGDVMLPHLEGRPLTLQRFPDGIGSDGFYQKSVPSGTPDWIGRIDVPTREGRQQQLGVGDVSTLAWLADQACVTLHVWPSREGNLDRPDRLIFDLDPPEGGSFSDVRQAARHVRELMEELDLVPFLQTTGSRGLHVVVPLQPETGYDTVRDFAREASDLLVSRHPDRYTTAARKEKREGRLYLDVMRNARGQTFVAPYAVRPLEGAPVATPLEWDELADDDLGPRTWHLKNIRRRLAARDDPWSGMGRRARRLNADRRRRLEGMTRDG
jgi:bifunctional non-homologous end joining protein LigD